MNLFRHTTLLVSFFSLFSLGSHAQDGNAGQSISEVDSDEDRIEFKQIRASLEYGLSTRTAKVAPGLNRDEAGFAEKLRDGMDYRVSVEYFIDPHLGFGLCYNRWLTNYSATGKFMVGETQGTYFRTSNEDMNYFGPSLIGRLYGKSSSLLGSVGLGYYNYYSETRMENPGFFGSGWVKGATLGLNVAVSLDLKLVKNLYIGFSGYYQAGSIKKFEVKDFSGAQKEIEFDNNSGEGITRVGGAIGLRLYLLPKVIQNKSED